MSKKKISVRDFLCEGSDWELSLNKLVSKKIVDVTGYASCPFDECTPVFKIYQIIFEDGTNISVEGEHDVPYLPADESLRNMDEKTLKKLSEE